MWRAAFDIGGTFTDFVLAAPDSPPRFLKVASSPDDPARAVIAGFERLLAEVGIAASGLDTILHATTVATNAIIERKGCPTALLTTDGFRDVLIHRGRLLAFERPGAGHRQLLLSFGGYEGRVDSDGPEALAPVMNCRNIPVEVHETNNPVRIHCLGLIEDSGGAGRHRGGCGLRKDIELCAPSATLTLLGDRHTYAPYGLFGGHPGSRAETLLVRDGETEPLGSKDVVELRGGDVVSFRIAGAGGYGDPQARDRDAVRNDVADGFVSERAARVVYGLEVTSNR